MSFYEEALQANARYAEGFQYGHLPLPPARKAVVLTCMDARLIPNEFLGFNIGEVHVIRNAGALATDDAIRSLVISTNLLGTREIVIIAHTDCGMLTFRDDEVREQLQQNYGADASNLALHAFSDLHESVRKQVQRVRECPFIAKDIPVHGLIYHVETGKLEEVAHA
ncbi:MAG: carbonic anhydrase [Chthonomonadetes bacterium]|jgi:carbonic anhydrase|nr:carbonic anhydrase [Chthonomonadetes bacterium]